MRLPTMPYVSALMLALAVGLIAPDAQARKAKPLPELTAQGEQLKAAYAEQLSAVQAKIESAMPRISTSAKQAYTRALETEAKAKQDLASANAELGKIGAAHGLIGHARNHWIPKADRGIKAAKDKLTNAKTDAERAAAKQEIAKWEQNRADGVAALEERTANYEKLKREEPRLKRQVESAKRDLKKAQERVAHALKTLRLDRVLESDKLDADLAKLFVIKHATPHGLAAYAQQGDTQRELIDKLLVDEKLLLQMAYHDGAKDGNYGKAMEIYEAIQVKSPKAKSGVYQRLALAIALEHATPIKQRNPVSDTDAPGFVDPVGRYTHFVNAYESKSLDPYFDTHEAWALRFVVNGDEPDETLAWGREMLRNYRPDHITTKDDRWRYVALVRTCIRYGSQENKYDKPELQFYQNILMNGGICGRRAFIGRFILRSFGVPTVAKPQRGHAALGRWTPNGWVAVLGAGWNTGWAPGREMAAIDFLAVTQARATDAYMQVRRAQWIGDAEGETRKLGFNTGGKAGFWNSVALNIQRKVIEEAGTKALAAVGEELGEANESKVKYPFESAEITDEDRKVRVDGKGVITIPAAATTTPTKSTGKILFLDSVLGGKQLTYNRNGNEQDFEYTFDAPAAGQYELTMKVATPSWKQKLNVIVNAGQKTSMELPHTVGAWQTTAPLTIELKKGKNTLRFSRKGIEQEVASKGFTIKELTLTPAGDRIGRLGNGPWVAE